METLKVLNKKRIKEILGRLSNQYGFRDNLDYAFFMNSKGRVFLLSKKFKDFEHGNLNINSLGLYFATFKGDEIRLSVEGSQMVGGQCKEGVVKINEKELRKWLRGEDLEDIDGKGFVLVKNKDDFFGSGRVVNNKLLNFIPKERRVEII